jgi:AraC family transcriptional regulator
MDSPEIRSLPETKLIGKSMRMSFADNKTFELWKSFMPARKQIQHTVSNNLFSLQVYDPGFDFNHVNPQATFDKMAAAEVSDFSKVPDDMVTFTVPGGLYAVFLHKGPASQGAKTFQYILVFGYRSPDINWIAGHTLNYWEKNISMKHLTQKKKFGCR